MQHDTSAPTATTATHPFAEPGGADQNVEDQDAALFLRRVQLLYDQSGSSYAGSLISAIALGVILWNTTPHAQLIPWVSTFTMITAARYLLRFRFYRSEQSQDSATRWLQWFVGLTVASGAMWGIGTVLLPPADSPIYAGLVVLWVAGLSAATVATYSAVFTAFLAFSIPAALPFIAYAVIWGDATHVSIAALLVLYLVFLILSARRMQRAILTSLRLQFENVELRLDIDHRERAEKQLRALLESAPDAMVITDKAGEIVLVNAQTEKLFGYAKNELIGKDVDILMPERFRGINSERRTNYFDGLSVRATNASLELYAMAKDGREFPVEISLGPLETPDGMLVSSAIRDVTEAHQMRQQMAHQASHDSLTDLVNRQEFENRLGRVLETAHTERTQHALCFLDLDQFKVVNDTCGHVAGDELLRQLSILLQEYIRQRDTLARLGGDEFGILMEHCSLDHARRVTNTLRQSVEEFRFHWEDKSFGVGVSVGLVPITESSGNIASIMSAADSACYAAKDAGRNRVHVYHADDAELAERQGEMQWVTRIERALEEDRFCLAFQTIVPVNGRRQEGAHYELLLRMKDEEGGLVLPNAFLPAAERYSLSTKLDRWIVASALAWLTEHPEHTDRLHLCSINLSGHSLADPDFLELTMRQLDRSRVAPEKICFEVSETAAITNLSHATRFIKALKQLGCKVSLDDFGSGLSSFAYLKNLPVDFLKIDGAFVRGIVDDRVDLAMVHAINEIGQVMNKKTIAEFVENEAILGKLQEIGVDYAQGYAISEPRPITEMS